MSLEGVKEGILSRIHSLTAKFTWNDLLKTITVSIFRQAFSALRHYVAPVLIKI